MQDVGFVDTERTTSCTHGDCGLANRREGRRLWFAPAKTGKLPQADSDGVGTVDIESLQRPEHEDGDVGSGKRGDDECEGEDASLVASFVMGTLGTWQTWYPRCKVWILLLLAIWSFGHPITRKRFVAMTFWSRVCRPLQHISATRKHLLRGS